MKYKIVTVENNHITVWASFSFPSPNPSSVLSFMYYIKSSLHFENFFVINEYGDAYKLTSVFDKICNSLRVQEYEE